MPSEKGTILYVGGFELPDKNAAAHRVLNNGKALRALGYNVVFLGISHSTEELIVETYQGFECYSIPYPNAKKQWLEYLTSIKVLKQIAANTDNLKGIIFYNYQSVCQMKAINYCRRKKLWSVVDVTEWYLASKKNPIFYAVKQADTSFRMRYLNKKANGIIAISKFLNDYYIKSGCKNVIQLPPLVDLNEEKWCKSATCLNDKIRLIYAGSPGEIKDNFSIVLKNICQMKDRVEFHILGMDRETVAGQLPQEQIDQYLGDHVIIHGRVSHAECLKHIKESDFQIFIRPDNLVTRAGFPTKLGESFACGIPVITNLSSNIEDFLTEGKNCFIVSDLSDGEIHSVLSKIVALNKDEIIEIKQYCGKYNAFNYSNYINEIKAFFDKFE